MKTFSYRTIATDKISASDLREEAAEYAKEHSDAQAFSITIYDKDGQNPAAETAEALYLPYEDRLGIEWGADATWADVSDIESGIEMWLNDGEAWAAAN